MKKLMLATTLLLSTTTSFAYDKQCDLRNEFSKNLINIIVEDVTTSPVRAVKMDFYKNTKLTRRNFREVRSDIETGFDYSKMFFLRRMELHNNGLSEKNRNKLNRLIKEGLKQVNDICEGTFKDSRYSSHAPRLFIVR